VFQQFFYKPTNPNAIGVPVLSAAQSHCFTTNITLIYNPNIPKCNYLNGSDHRVVASYSGLHEEREVNISVSHPYPILDMLSVWVLKVESLKICKPYLSTCNLPPALWLSHWSQKIIGVCGHVRVLTGYRT